MGNQRQAPAYEGRQGPRSPRRGRCPDCQVGQVISWISCVDMNTMKYIFTEDSSDTKLGTLNGEDHHDDHDHQGGLMFNSKRSRRWLRPQTYAVLSQDCICRDLHAISGYYFQPLMVIQIIFYPQRRLAVDRIDWFREKRLVIN